MPRSTQLSEEPALKAVMFYGKKRLTYFLYTVKCCQLTFQENTKKPPIPARTHCFVYTFLAYCIYKRNGKQQWASSLCLSDSIIRKAQLFFIHISKNGESGIQVTLEAAEGAEKNSASLAFVPGNFRQPLQVQPSQGYQHRQTSSNTKSTTMLRINHVLAQTHAFEVITFSTNDQLIFCMFHYSHDMYLAHIKNLESSSVEE